MKNLKQFYWVQLDILFAKFLLILTIMFPNCFKEIKDFDFVIHFIIRGRLSNWVLSHPGYVRGQSQNTIGIYFPTITEAEN